MKNFNIQVRDVRNHEWYTVSDVSFRFWKNHPSDGLNGPLTVLGIDGLTTLEGVYIEDVKLNVW